MDQQRTLIKEIQTILTDAIRFWEIGRIVYNFVLVLIVLVTFQYHTAWSYVFENVLDIGVMLLLLALLANVLYSVAYIPDVFVQLSSYQDTWRAYRWILFLTGTLIASVLAVLTTSSHISFHTAEVELDSSGLIHASGSQDVGQAGEPSSDIYLPVKNQNSVASRERKHPCFRIQTNNISFPTDF